MATRTPLVQASGEVQQLQSGDPLSPVSVAVLRVLTANYTLPTNTSLVFIDSLTLSNNVSLTIPSSSAISIESDIGVPVIPWNWDSVTQVATSNFTTASASFVNITGLTYSGTANSLYEVECVLRVQDITSSNGARFTVTCGGTGAAGSVVTYGPSSSVTSAGIAANALGGQTGTLCSFLNTNALIVMKVVVLTGTAGVITAQVLSAAGDTISVFVGSVMKIKKLA